MENKIDPKLMTKEMMAKVMACETPEELMALARENGAEMTAEQAKAYLAKLENLDGNLSDEDMAKVAGGAPFFQGSYDTQSRSVI
ncbi:MAG: Nif11-like leader peptide family RiPP precursor [Schwartzia sp.]|nr:Nif11-like leader peptide family RiPP precursor [Schwartzia sp. (in: firmicutes)]